MTNGRSTIDFGIQSLTPWYGGSYQVGWNNGRTTTNNIFTNFDPQLTSSFSASYTQPLLRNFKIDGTRQQLLISQKNREISDVQLQQSIAVTVRNVSNAYYDLMYAIGNLNVQRQSLELAQQSLKDNRARVEIGTMAPLDIVQAEAEVATREEVGDPRRGGDRARAGHRARRSSTTRRRRTSGARGSSPPSRSPSSRPWSTSTRAVRNALSQRTDIAVARKNLESNDVNIRYFQNQSMPDLNASVNYSAQAIGGVGLLRGPSPGLQPGPIIGTVERSYSDTLGTVFSGDFPGWTCTLTWPTRSAGRAPRRSSRERGCRTRRLKSSWRALELQVAQQVREFGRQVQTNAKRVDATRVVARAGRAPARSGREEISGRHDAAASSCCRRSAT